MPTQGGRYGPTASGRIVEETAIRTLDSLATAAAFPLGGIGTGTVSIGNRGQLQDWEIANSPNKHSYLPWTFFAIRAAHPGCAEAVKVLESEIAPPFVGDFGYKHGTLAGLPRFEYSQMRGSYPIVEVEFEDAHFPARVSLRAFNPLVPHCVSDSGMPIASLRYRVSNPTDLPLEVSVAASMSNPVGIVGQDVYHGSEYVGEPRVRAVSTDEFAGLEFSTNLNADHVLYGSAVIAADTAHRISWMPQWAQNSWGDGTKFFWDMFEADGNVRPVPADIDDELSNRSRNPALCVGSLVASCVVQPGAEQDFEFTIAWHFPNRAAAWHGNVGLPSGAADRIAKNFYATTWTDAQHVTTDFWRRRSDLTRSTDDFTEGMFSSTLPPAVVDAAASNLSALRSTTCLYLDNGTAAGQFAAWEGSFDSAGSCEGTCTHVWNYAQSVAYLFPELERTARENEFLNEVDASGCMRFRTNAIFGNPPWEHLPAADGQLGTIVRLYREFRMSGDISFLSKLWPQARSALEYAMKTWDLDGDFVLEGVQHNTYDIEFQGISPLTSVLFIAALRAAAEMCAAQGYTAEAARYREIADLSAARVDALLYNGQYYQQELCGTDDVYQVGVGCLSDQLFGQTLAHLVGLGPVLPRQHLRSAMQSIVKYNFRDPIERHSNLQRVFALDGESGTLLCSWPSGQRPVYPFIYSDEVWTGVEYQVATGLIFEDLVDEALALVRAARDRYNGYNRNPWNEIECGNHYARSLASWGLVPALTGAQWDGTTRRLLLAPKDAVFDRNGAASFPVSVGTGFMSVTFRKNIELRALAGEVNIDTFDFVHPTLGRLTTGAAGVVLSAGEGTVIDVLADAGGD